MLQVSFLDVFHKVIFQAHLATHA